MAIEVCVVDPQGNLTAPLDAPRYGSNLAIFYADLDLGGQVRCPHVVNVWILPTVHSESVVRRCRFIFVGGKDTFASYVQAEKLIHVREELTKERLVEEMEMRLNPPCDVAIDLASLTLSSAGVALACAGSETKFQKMETGYARSTLEQVTWLITTFAHFAVCCWLQ